MNFLPSHAPIGPYSWPAQMWSRGHRWSSRDCSIHSRARPEVAGWTLKPLRKAHREPYISERYRSLPIFVVESVEVFQVNTSPMYSYFFPHIEKSQISTLHQNSASQSPSKCTLFRTCSRLQTRLPSSKVQISLFSTSTHRSPSQSLLFPPLTTISVPPSSSSNCAV